MGLILALDQGGTKTAALVANASGEILGAGYGRGACHAESGMEVAMGAVMEAAGAALSAAGATLAQVETVCGGMAGADWPDEYPLLENALRETTGVRNVQVVNDCIIAWRAGTDCPVGAVLCAGTALNAAVIGPHGQSYIFGYYISGDDLGGTALGRLSLRAVFAAESGIGPGTRLTDLLLSHFGLASVDDLMRAYVSGKLGRTSTLVPVLEQAVALGDDVAVRLVADFGERLARYVTAGQKRFGMLQCEQDVVLSGGVFKAHLPGLRESVTRAVLREAPRARLVDARYEPVVGALLLALPALTLPALAESAARHQLLRQGGIQK